MRDRAECEAVVRQMWGYLDGALPGTQSALVSKHVATCVECAAHFDFAAEFLNAVARTLPRQAATTVLRDRVLAALATEPAAGSSAPR